MFTWNITESLHFKNSSTYCAWLIMYTNKVADRESYSLTDFIKKAPQISQYLHAHIYNLFNTIKSCHLLSHHWGKQ